MRLTRGWRRRDTPPRARAQPGAQCVSWSEPRGDGEHELARRRIRTEVDVARDRLLSVVARLGVVAPVVREDEQVAAGDLDSDVARSEEPLGHVLGQRIADAHFAQLEERGGLHVRRRDAVEAILDARWAGRSTGVGGQLVAVVERERLVLRRTAVLPVPQGCQEEALVRE